MSEDDRDDQPPPKVGYKMPPVHTRFQPGRSGNPRGRPKGRRNLKHDLEQELAERITVREGDRSVRISKQRAIVKSTVAKAIKGDGPARAKAFELLLRAFGIDDEIAVEDALSPQDEDILAAYLARKTRSVS